MKRHGKTRGELTINPTNYSRNKRKLLPGEHCQTTHMILQPLELLRSYLHLMIFLLLLHRSNKWGLFSVTGVVHSVFLYCPGLRARAELHHDLSGIFVKIHSEETQILKNCYVTPTTTQLRAENEGNNAQWESKIHLKILKGKPERGREGIYILLLR